MTPDQVKALALGGTVLITATLKRRMRWEGARGNVRWKRWMRSELPQPVRAVSIGWRSLVEGKTEWEDEVGYVFFPDESTRQVAALVVLDRRRMPVLVPCDAIALTGED